MVQTWLNLGEDVTKLGDDVPILELNKQLPDGVRKLEQHLGGPAPFGMAEELLQGDVLDVRTAHVTVHDFQRRQLGWEDNVDGREQPESQRRQVRQCRQVGVASQ